jgi:hypothetical protein
VAPVCNGGILGDGYRSRRKSTVDLASECFFFWGGYFSLSSRGQRIGYTALKSAIVDDRSHLQFLKRLRIVSRCVRAIVIYTVTDSGEDVKQFDELSLISDRARVHMFLN